MAGILLAMSSQSVSAEERTIDVSGNNTSSSYKTYNTAFSLPAGDIVNVKMARYCYFSSTITGKGVLNLYAGGERCYLGTAKGAAWPNWTNYTGDIHIYPYKENSPSLTSYGVVLAHGGKSSSPENALDDAKSGKVNPSMASNRVTLHEGATICCEANTNGAGFRIGELNTEVGSTLMGYMKKANPGRSVYYLLGGLNTDATLAGTIMPASNDDNTPLSIVKEGTGTYSITGNDNYLSGALRILQGRVLVMNDRAEAESQHLRGALGAKPNVTDAIAYVFSNGVLGGTGSIGGMVDNYGTIEPGAGGIGVLTLKNYTADLATNLTVRPSSRLRFKVAAADNYDQLLVNGNVNYNNITENFSASDKMPIIEMALEQTADIAIGTEFRVLTVNSKQAGDWHFDVRANKYTWAVEEREENGQVVFIVRLVSYADMEIVNGPDEDDEANNPIYTMGAFYDDGISDSSDRKSLSYYAQQNNKFVGVALCTYKGLSSERETAGKQFNMMVCENEMKFDALEGSRNSFSFGSADNLVTLAQQNNMAIRGHCLVWHSQLPTWVSSDGKKNDKNWTREEALEIMKNHITKVMQHYKGKVREWDVVNECLDDDQTTVRTNPSGYDLRQQSVWQRAIGDDYVELAFQYAHEADPDAELYLNDYGVEFQGKAKSEAFYNLAVSLKKKGIPIHGVGLQCHFNVGEVDGVKLNRAIKRFAEAGLKCIITELDLGISSTSSENLEEQARIYRMITDIVLNNDNCPSMVIWGIKDNDSWRTNSNPLLYDSGMGRKPAWYAVRSALRHRTLSSDGISSIHHHNVPSDGFVYDLNGRRVSTTNLQSGLYIKDGKKIVIKPSHKL